MLTFKVFASSTLTTRQKKLEPTLLLNLLPQPPCFLLRQLLQCFLHLRKCHNQQSKITFLILLLSDVTMWPCDHVIMWSHPIKTPIRMSRFDSPFFHTSIQLFSCIWHLPTMFQMNSYHINNQEDVSWSKWFLLSHISSYINSRNLSNTFQAA